MQTITVPEYKQWAVGLVQVEFEREFMRRHPVADFIPTVDGYLDFPEPVVIDFRGVRPDDLLNDEATPAKPPRVEEKMQVTSCRGCGRQFKMPKGAFLAKSSHERRCQIFKEKFPGGLK